MLAERRAPPMMAAASLIEATRLLSYLLPRLPPSRPAPASASYSSSGPRTCPPSAPRLEA